MPIAENNTDPDHLAAAAAPRVIMLMGQHCNYCGPMMVQLTELMKAGKIARLEITNIEQRPDIAASYQARSVPWLKIGPFTLEGMRTKSELVDWLQRAEDFQEGGEAAQRYFEEVLAEGKIAQAEQLIGEYPEALSGVIELVADPDAKINVRLGVGVIIETLAEKPVFAAVVPRLIELLYHDDARVRSDACHYLSLTRMPEMATYIEPLLKDKSAEVREIARDSLEELQG
jgi:hypothetical protein